MRAAFCFWQRGSAVCRWSATTPRASKKPSPAMAAPRRNKCNARFSASWGWRNCRNRPTLPTPSLLPSAITTWSNYRLASRERKRPEEIDMITKISGVLNRVLDEEVRLQAGALEYQVLVPEFIRRRVQGNIG